MQYKFEYKFTVAVMHRNAYYIPIHNIIIMLSRNISEDEMKIVYEASRGPNKAWTVPYSV